MTLLERLDGDKHVTTMGNIHVTTMGEYTRDHHTRDTSQFIVGKTYLSRVLYTERCLLFIQITCTDDAYGTVYLLIVDFKQFCQFNRNM